MQTRGEIKEMLIVDWRMLGNPLTPGYYNPLTPGPRLQRDDSGRRPPLSPDKINVTALKCSAPSAMRLPARKIALSQIKSFLESPRPRPVPGHQREATTFLECGRAECLGVTACPAGMDASMKGCVLISDNGHAIRRRTVARRFVDHHVTRDHSKIKGRHQVQHF